MGHSTLATVARVTDLLIRNARLVPLRGEMMIQVLVDALVQDGAVTQVAPGLVRPDGAEEIDADGRWLAPGLWDQHTHLTQWVERRQRLDLAGAGSVEEATAIVAASLIDHPGQPVVGWGHRSAFMGRDGTTSELDAVSTEVPILLISGDGHHAWGNSLGLGQLGLPVRDEVVRENEWFDAYPRLGIIAGRSDTPAAYRDALRRLRPRAWSGWSTSSSTPAASRGSSAGARAATCCASAGRRTPPGWTRSSRRACAPATRCPAPTTGSPWDR